MEHGISKLLAVLCVKCWNQISSFNNFVQSILLLQSQLEKDEKPIIIIASAHKDEIPALEERSIEPNITSGSNNIQPSPIPADILTTNLPELEDNNVIVSSRNTQDEGCLTVDEEFVSLSEAEIQGTAKENQLLTTEQEIRIKIESNLDTNDREPSNDGSNCDNQEFADLITIKQEPMEFIDDETHSQADVAETHLSSDDSRDASEDSTEESNPTQIVFSTEEANWKLTKDSSQTSDAQKQNTPIDADIELTNWKPFLDCHICQDNFDKLPVLQTHFEEKHSNSEAHIKCCGQNFETVRDFEDHKRLHVNMKNPKPIISIVRKPSQLDDELRKHIHIDLDAEIARWMPEVMCNVCGEKFRTFSETQRHVAEEHPNSKSYMMCCKQKFDIRHEFAEHVRSHMDPNNFRCQICKKFCISKTNLAEHMFNEHNIVPEDKQELKRRKLSTKPKPEPKRRKSLTRHKCPQCDKKFKLNSDLCAHLSSHVPEPSNDTSLRCSHCKKSFKYKSTLHYHVNTAHPGMIDKSKTSDKSDDGEKS